MKLPKVSVAIICYNQENFIRDAIDSVIAQDYPNIEICVSDDCSTDKTPKIILEYAERLDNHPNIKFRYNLNPTNVGIVRNYNNVLNLCTGDYIAWLDGDDMFIPNKLAKQVNFMQEHPECVISYTDCDNFNSDTGITKFYSKSRMAIFDSDSRGVIKHGSIFCNCTTMVVGDIQRQVRFNANYHYLGDWLNKVEILLQSQKKIMFIDEVLSRYRLHSCNTTNSAGHKINNTTADIINQYVMLLNKYPRLSSDILFGLSRVYRSLGKYTNIQYFKVAFQIKPLYWKNITMYLYYLLKKL